MNDNEVNKIIAEFMGTKIIDWGKHQTIGDGQHLYTTSLDALVPVWKKLEIAEFGHDSTLSRVAMEIDDGCFENEKSIQQAAAHATAKAILELSDD